MNAVSLYLSTCRYIMQASPENPYSWGDLYKYLPYLRQALSCCVCTHILHIPMGPIDTICQHHVCQQCIGGKMRLYPSCSWCKDFTQFQENTQLRIVIQCYKKLCQYLTHSTVLNVFADVDNGDKNSIMSIIQEGVTISDIYDYGANPLPLSSFYTKCQSPRRYLEFDQEAEKNAAASSSTSKEPVLQPCSPKPASPGVSTEYVAPTSPPPLSPGLDTKERKRMKSAKNSGSASNSVGLLQSDLGHSNQNESEEHLPVSSSNNADAASLDTSNSKKCLDFDSSTENKKCLDSESGTDGLDTSAETRQLRDSSCEQQHRSRSRSGTEKTRHKSGGRFHGTKISDNHGKDTQKELSSNEAVSKSDCGFTSSDSERERREKKEQRSRRTSTTRVAIGDCMVVDSAHKHWGEKEKATVAEPDTSQPTPQVKPPPLSPRVCLGEHDYMKESPYYSVSMPNGNEAKLTIRRKHPSSSPGHNSPRKRHRTDDHIPHLISSPMLSPSSGSQKSKKKRLSKEAKKKGCRCGTAASTPGKLTCCGQRCPCYSTHNPCLDCSCRGCHNPRKLVVPDSTVSEEDDNEDVEIFVDI